jgi:putative phosphoribosyl transferase
LSISTNPKSLIIFALGSGSSALSTGNNQVASILNDNGFATLLVEILRSKEQDSYIKSQKYDLLISEYSNGQYSIDIALKF